MSVNKRFGTVGAILAGDFLHAQAMALVGKLGGRDALSVFTEATRGMVDGEFTQLRNARNFSQSIDDYFSVVMGKTALLIGAACEVGSMFAGAGEECRSALKNYGLSLGSAFQIVDDLLDYLGDQRKTGKTVGNDLAEGKMTLPLIITLQRAAGNDRSRLLAILESKTLRQSGFSEVFTLIDAYDGFAEARARAEEIIAEAVAALRAFPDQQGSESFAFLHGLSQYVLSRDH